MAEYKDMCLFSLLQRSRKSQFLGSVWLKYDNVLLPQILHTLKRKVTSEIAVKKCFKFLPQLLFELFFFFTVALLVTYYPLTQV